MHHFFVHMLQFNWHCWILTRYFHFSWGLDAPMYWLKPHQLHLEESPPYMPSTSNLTNIYGCSFTIATDHKPLNLKSYPKIKLTNAYIFQFLYIELRAVSRLNFCNYGTKASMTQNDTQKVLHGAESHHYHKAYKIKIT